MPDDKYSVLVDDNPLKLRDLAWELEHAVVKSKVALDKLVDDSANGYTTTSSTADELAADALAAISAVLAKTSVLVGYD